MGEKNDKMRAGAASASEEPVCTDLALHLPISVPSGHRMPGLWEGRRPLPGSQRRLGCKEGEKTSSDLLGGTGRGASRRVPAGWRQSTGCGGEQAEGSRGERRWGQAPCSPAPPWGWARTQEVRVVMALVPVGSCARSSRSTSPHSTWKIIIYQCHGDPTSSI